MDRTATTQTNCRRERWIATGGLLLLFAILVGLFWPAMHSPFVFDDNISVSQVKSFEHWSDAFQVDAFRFFRPIKNLFFYVYLESGASIVWAHIWTVGAYLVATLGVFALASRITSSLLWGLAAAAVWSLSAANVTVAIWASCFNISVAIAAMTFGLTAWDRWRENPSQWKFALIFGLLLILGLLSYETAVATAPLAVMIDLYRGRSVFSKGSIVRYLVIAAIVCAWFSLRHTSGAKFENEINPSFSPDIERWQITVSAPYFLWTHFQMWIAPWGKLECLGSYIWNLSIPAIIIPFCWILLLGVIALCIRAWKPGAFFIFSLAWFLIAAFPSGNFLPFGNTPYADYYVPIPAIGLAFAVVALIRALTKTAKTSPHLRHVAIGCIAILIICRVANLTAMHHWIDAWKDPLYVMAETAEARPYQFLAKAATASALFENGQTELAKDYANDAIKDLDCLDVPHLILGGTHFSNEEWDEAEKSFKTALQRRHLSKESIFVCYLRLGQIIGRDPNRIDESFTYLIRVLKKRESVYHPQAVLATADLFRVSDRLKEEVEALQKGAKYHPGNEAIQLALRDATTRLKTKTDEQ